MKSHRENAANIPERRFLTILADVNEHMITVWNRLHLKTAVAAATRGCDIRRYQDKFIDGEEVQRFEAYVEAKTHAGEIFVWSIDITQTSRDWQLQRSVARQTTDGEEVQKEFEDFTFGTFDEFANNYMALMIEFNESAENLDFSSPNQASTP